MIGFVHLHSLFVQRGRLETIWAVFRKFGYDENLNLRDDFLRPPMDMANNATTELSPKGYQFFTDLFQVFDKVNNILRYLPISRRRIRMARSRRRSSTICSLRRLETRGFTMAFLTAPPPTRRMQLLYGDSWQCGGILTAVLICLSSPS